MTRILSELLGAREPHFRIALKQLEQAAGAPSEDIRLTGDVNVRARAKLRDLGLDPKDTTGQELYHALHGRVQRDNATLLGVLGHETAPTNLMPRVARLISGVELPRQVFGLRNASAKRLLKAQPPKRVMKQLGYRSLDSMLKHETPCSLLAAARIAESAAWHKTMYAKYRQLLPSDFEMRDVTITAPTHSRWEKFAQPYVAQHQHNIITVREAGAVILLPMSGRIVDGAPLAATVLTLHAVHDLRAVSTYMKLHQVQADFGALVARVSQAEPITEARLLRMPLPWKLVHGFFARNPRAYTAELFEPHVQPADLAHEPVEATLSKLHPTFEFWEGTTHLALHHNGGTVSFNPIDAVLNFCNHLPYEQRIVKYVRQHLWQELLLRYMRQDNLERSLREQLGSELVGQPALV